VLGRCYFKTGNYGNAEGILRHALALDPNNYAATNLLGQTLMAEGKMEEGRALLEKLKGMERK
jgi:cytochrome c-type biogenesis protein CcmH/NrfG